MGRNGKPNSRKQSDDELIEHDPNQRIFLRSNRILPSFRFLMFLRRLSRTRDGRCHNRGLTLIEIMVATLILAVVASSAYLILNYFDLQTKEASDQLLAIRLASNQLAQIKNDALTGNGFPPDGSQDYCSSGCGANVRPELLQLAFPGTTTPTRMTIQVVPHSTGASNAKQVIVGVFYPSRFNSSPKQVVLTDFIYVP